MQLKDLAENISWGIPILSQYLTDNDSEGAYLFLNSDCFKDDTILIENTKYISYKNIQKHYTAKKLLKLQYGDFIFDSETFNLAIFTEEKNVIASEKLLIIRQHNAYLRQILLNDAGRFYVKNELKKALRAENNFEKIKSITIPDNFETIVEIQKESLRPDRLPLDTLTINVRQGLMTLDKILKRIEHKEINLNTGFQRKSDLWGFDRKSRLIEALIVKQPIPSFYFDATETTEEENIWQIVDGLQRLTAIKQFVIDKSFVLQELYYLPQYQGKNFDQLPRSAQRNIEEYEAITYIIEPPTPKTVKYKIFKSINTSPLSLVAQEIRHSLNQGNPANWLAKFTDDKITPIFEKVVPVSEINKERMLDREIALRYLAFRMTHYQDIKTNSTELLDEAMTQIFAFEELMPKYYEEFKEALFVIDYIFGEIAFTKAMIGGQNTGFINSIFEIWTYAISVATKEQQEILKSRKKIVKEAALTLNKISKFTQSIEEQPYTRENLRIRFSTVEQLIKEITK